MNGARYLAACALLRASDAAGALFLNWGKGRALAGRASLPDADPDPRGRAHGLVHQRARYATVPLRTRFALSCDVRHDTVAELPAEQRYTWPMLASKLPILASVRLNVRSPARIRAIRDLDPLFTLLPTPASRGFWDDDRAFARQRLTGPNPMLLARVPPDSLGVEGLAASLLPGRPVYAVDHRPLLRRVTARPGTCLPPVVAVFQEDAAGLAPIAIAAEGSRGTLVARPGGPGWRLLRALFQSADFWVHEAVVHYLWTHVVGEKFVLATCRQLSPRHPLRRLLGPHHAHTLQMNRNGVQRLMVDDGLFDSAFAAGRDGKAAAITWGNERWRFWRMIHPENVERRGLEGLRDHPWRDDAKLVWDAVHEHVQEYVGRFYGSDVAVQNDPEVAAWSRELHEALGDRGFPLPDGRDSLALVLAAAVFDVVQHDLVNAPQYDHYAWPLNASSMVRAELPSDLRDADDDPVAWLPELGVCRSAALATYAFSRRFEPLGADLGRWYPREARDLAPAWGRRLRAVDRQIAERNVGRPTPYRTASPWVLGNSVSA